MLGMKLFCTPLGEKPLLLFLSLIFSRFTFASIVYSLFSFYRGADLHYFPGNFFEAQFKILRKRFLSAQFDR